MGRRAVGQRGARSEEMGGGGAEKLGDGVQEQDKTRLVDETGRIDARMPRSTSNRKRERENDCVFEGKGVDTI